MLVLEVNDCILYSGTTLPTGGKIRFTLRKVHASLFTGAAKGCVTLQFDGKLSQIATKPHKFAKASPLEAFPTMLYLVVSLRVRYQFDYC